MSRLISILAMLFFTVQSIAQSGFPFPGDQAEWVVSRWQPNFSIQMLEQWKYWLNGDTLVEDGNQYSAVYARGTCFTNVVYDITPYEQAVFGRIGGLRQQGDSIFFRRSAVPFFEGAPPALLYYPVNQEVLLYDFSLKAGDTLQYAVLNRKLVVDSVHVTLEGRKEISLSVLGCGYPYSLIWIEGQGCNQGLLENLCYHPQYFTGISCCFASITDGDDPCPLPCTPADPVLVATTSPAGSGSVRVHPNPTSDILHLSIPDPLAPMHLVLLDITGHPVLVRKAVRDQDALDLSGLAPGSYICQVSSRRGEFQVFKVVRLP